MKKNKNYPFPRTKNEIFCANRVKGIMPLQGYWGQRSQGLKEVYIWKF